METLENGTIIVGMTQVIKGMKIIKSEYLPVIAILVGILLSFSQKGVSLMTLVEGMITGLISTGLVHKANEFRN